MYLIVLAFHLEHEFSHNNFKAEPGFCPVPKEQIQTISHGILNGEIYTEAAVFDPAVLGLIQVSVICLL